MAAMTDLEDQLLEQFRRMDRIATKRLDGPVQRLITFLDSLPPSDERRRAESDIHSVLNGFICVSSELRLAERRVELAYPTTAS